MNVTISSCDSAVSAAAFDMGAQCTLDSSYSFFVISETPSPSQINRVCMSPACSQVVAAIRKAVANECEIKLMNKRIQLYKDVMNPIAAVCAKGSVVVTGPPKAVSNNETNSTASSGIASCSRALEDAAFNSVNCSADSGYSFFVIRNAPSENEITKICASANCSASIAAIKKAVPNECLTGGLGRNELKLYEQILNPIDLVCKKPEPSSSTTNKTETSPPVSQTVATTAPTPTPKSAASKSRRSITNALAVALAVLAVAPSET
jgi:hypothetical protein